MKLVLIDWQKVHIIYNAFMIIFYLTKIKNVVRDSALSILKSPSTFSQILTFSVIGISLCLSLYLSVGMDLGDVSLNTILLNECLYLLLGLSVLMAQHLSLFPIAPKINSSLMVTTSLNVLYMPILWLLPHDLSLSMSVPLINWFVLTFFLEALQKIKFKPFPQESKIVPSSPQHLEELFKRAPLKIDNKSVYPLLKDKRILIIGALNSFGNELLKYVGQVKPSRLGLVDNHEYLLFQAALEAKDVAPKVACETFLGDISFRDRIRHIISTFKPEIVIHDGTLRQVPFGEENPSYCVLTNVIGTQNIADACRDFKVKALINLSSHDAQQPVNVVGATKRLAEGYCQSLHVLEKKKPSGTNYVNVRVGNLLDAPGSVVPLFKSQLEKGGLLTVTHVDAMRYFIRAGEAVALVFQSFALEMEKSKRESSVYVVDRGEPLKIVDLANQMIQISGGKCKVEFIGLRPGDRLIDPSFNEELQSTSHDHVFTVENRSMDHGFLIRALRELEVVAKNQDQDSVIRLLQALVPDYQRSGEQEESVSTGTN